MATRSPSTANRQVRRRSGGWRSVVKSMGRAEPSMKKEEARRALVSEYERWAKKHPNDARMMGGFLFFRHLQKERSDLLDSRGVGDDKWQIVHGWLRDRLED